MKIVLILCLLPLLLHSIQADEEDGIITLDSEDSDMMIVESDESDSDEDSNENEVTDTSSSGVGLTDDEPKPRVRRQWGQDQIFGTRGWYRGGNYGGGQISYPPQYNAGYNAGSANWNQYYGYPINTGNRGLPIGSFNQPSWSGNFEPGNLGYNRGLPEDIWTGITNLFPHLNPNPNPTQTFLNPFPHPYPYPNPYPYPHPIFGGGQCTKSKEKKGKCKNKSKYYKEDYSLKTSA